MTRFVIPMPGCLPRWLLPSNHRGLFLSAAQPAVHHLRASSNPCFAWAENNCAVTAVSAHAATVSRSTRCPSRRFNCPPWSAARAQSDPATTTIRACPRLEVPSLAGCRRSISSDQRVAHVEIVFHQLQPVKPHSFRHLGEPIPWQVDQPAFRRQFEEIDQLGAARRAADPGEAGALGDGVDCRGFAGIRAAGEGDFPATSGASWFASAALVRNLTLDRSTWPPLERNLLTLVYNLGSITVHISMG